MSTGRLCFRFSFCKKNSATARARSSGTPMHTPIAAAAPVEMPLEDFFEEVEGEDVLALALVLVGVTVAVVVAVVVTVAEAVEEEDWSIPKSSLSWLFSSAVPPGT